MVSGLCVHEVCALTHEGYRCVCTYYFVCLWEGSRFIDIKTVRRHREGKRSKKIITEKKMEERSTNNWNGMGRKRERGGILNSVPQSVN